MSAVWIAAEDARRGSVPARCAKTGERCIARHRLRSTDLPTWVEWATWTDLWPRRRRHAAMPVVLSMLPWVHRAHRTLERLRDGTALALPLLLLGLLLADGLPATVLGVVLLATVGLKVAVAVLGATWAISIHADVTGRWLLVGRLHADAAAATEAATRRPDEEPALAVPDITALSRATTPG